MIQLKLPDLNGLVKDLETIINLSKKVDAKLTTEIHEMAPQLEADNFGTGDITKKPRLSQVIKKMDAPDKLQEVSEALIGGLKMLINNQ